MYFVGTHERQLDDKGRLALPSPFRSHLGEHCYLVLGKNQCIEVVPANAFEAMVEQLMGQVDRGELSLQRQRTVAASATPVTVDKQGRVPINEAMRSYAGLTNSQPAVVTGNFKTVEIWQPERFQRVQELGTTDLAGDEL